MNWNNKKENYPKSYLLLTDKESNLHIGYDDVLTYKHTPHEDPYNERDLYDFFDKNGVIISIVSYHAKRYFTGNIFIVNDRVIPFELRTASRTSIEDFVFEKAFSILENYL